MADQSCENNCTYYVDKGRMPMYKWKFLWVIISATIVTVGLYVCIAMQYAKSLDAIVNHYSQYEAQTIASLPDVKLAKDSCYYLNEILVAEVQTHMGNVEALMKIQGSKLQSDFTLLSVWAGVLMIVFLIFSIYAMFKTDEMVKQGRDALKTLEETKAHAHEEVKKIDDIVQKEIAKVQETAQEEIKKLSDQTNGAIDQVKGEMETSRKEFNKIVEEKVKTFEEVRDDYLKTIKQADQNASSLFQQMKNIFIQQIEAEKMDQSSQEDEHGPK